MHIAHLLGDRTADAKATARSFFETVCPSLFSARAALCRDLGGRYRFEIGGATGGVWDLDFGAARVTEPDPKSPLELHVLMHERELTALLSGTLDLQQAIDDGRVVATGDKSAFAALAMFTRPLSEAELAPAAAAAETSSSLVRDGFAPAT